MNTKWILLSALLLTSAVQARASGLKANAPFLPTQEIEILDPNVDPEGRPVVRPKPKGNGVMDVDIPPTIIVHKYYYSGDRSFRGPYIPGGPSVVVAGHPRTGERVYVPTMMFPGFPTVTYRSSSIRYDYGPQSVEVCFGWFKPRVVYSQGTKVGESAKDVAERLGNGTRNLVQRTDLPVMADKVKTGAKNALANVTDATRRVSEAVRLPVINAARAIPGVSGLFKTPEPISARREDLSMVRQQAEFQRLETAFPPSNSR